MLCNGMYPWMPESKKRNSAVYHFAINTFFDDFAINTFFDANCLCNYFSKFLICPKAIQVTFHLMRS